MYTREVLRGPWPGQWTDDLNDAEYDRESATLEPQWRRQLSVAYTLLY